MLLIVKQNGYPGTHPRNKANRRRTAQRRNEMKHLADVSRLERAILLTAVLNERRAVRQLTLVGVALALLVGAAPAGAAWTPLGGALNADPTQRANHQAIATVAGAPWVAWTEYDAAMQVRAHVSQGSGNGFISRDNGLNGLSDVSDIAIASVGGVPYVALNGRTTGVTVMRWNGSGWAALGAPFEDDTNDSPKIVDVGGSPYVAYLGPVNGNLTVLVRRWNAQTQLWEQVGGAVSAHGPDLSGKPEITVISGVPYVAWAERVSAGSNDPSVFVARLNGSAWETVGSAIVHVTSEGLWSISLANVQGEPSLAWVQEVKSPSHATHVVRWDGTTWSALGDPLAQSIDPLRAQGLSASLAVVGGVPYLAWFPDSGQAVVSAWSGGHWDRVGGKLNRTSSDAAGAPVITDAGGKPVVAWWEKSDSNETQTIFASRFDADTDTAITSGPVNGLGTKDATPSFTFSADPAVNATFECSIDGAAFAVCDTPYTTPLLADGPHHLSVRATSPGYGVDPTPAGGDFTVDTVAPGTVITLVPNDGTSQKISDTKYSGTVRATADALDPAPGVGNGVTRCVLDPPTPPSTYEDVPVGQCPSPTTASLGKHTFYAASLDQALNIGPVASVTFTLLPAPDTQILGGPTGATFVSDPEFTLTSTIAGSTFKCRVDNGPPSPCNTPLHLPVQRGGTHTITVAAVSPEGAVDSTPATRTFTVTKTETHIKACRVSPFPAPQGQSQLGCGWGPNCNQRVLCGPALQTCPRSALCTISLKADFQTPPDPFMRAPSLTDRRRHEAGAWSVQDWIGYSRNHDCQVEGYPGSETSCAVSESQSFLGQDRPIPTYCAARAWTVADGNFDALPGDFGPDQSRFLACDARMTVGPASALDAVAVGTGLQLYAQTAGLAYVFSDVAPVAASGATIARRARAFRKPLRKRATKPGPVNFKPELTRAANRLLKRRHELVVDLHIRFTPKTGKTITRTRRVTFTHPGNYQAETRVKFKKYCRNHHKLRRLPACQRVLGP